MSYYKIRNWSKYQSGCTNEYIRNYVRLLAHPEYLSLSPAQRGVLHGLWLYTGLTREWPPQDPGKLRISLSLPRYKTLIRTLETLERKGFIEKTRNQLPHRRGEEIRETPPTPPNRTRESRVRRGEKSELAGLVEFWERDREEHPEDYAEEHTRSEVEDDDQGSTVPF